MSSKYHRGYGKAHSRANKGASGGPNSIAGQAESVLLQMVRGQAPDALNIESPIESRLHPLRQRPPILPVDLQQELEEEEKEEPKVEASTQPAKRFMVSHHHVKYKALTDLTKAFLVSLFIRLDTNNQWKKVSSLQRAIGVWRLFKEQVNHRMARRKWELDFARMKLKMDEKWRHSEERNRMLTNEKQSMRVEYEGYIDKIKRAAYTMNKLNPIARQQRLQDGWLLWRNLVLMKKLAEEQEAMHLSMDDTADEEVRGRAERIATMNADTIKALHKIQHIFTAQDKRIFRLKMVKCFFSWHIKAIVVRYKTAYVQTVDPLRAHIRYQERLLQRVEDDVQHELGKRQSSFKPALVTTGLGEKNALRVAAVRLSRRGHERDDPRDGYIAKYGDEEKRGGGRGQYGAQTRRGKQRHPHRTEARREREAAAALPLPRDHYVTPVSRNKALAIQKEQLASATTRGSPDEGEGESKEGVPLYVGEREADLYYDFDRMVRYHGVRELEALEGEGEGEGEKDMNEGERGVSWQQGWKELWDRERERSDPSSIERLYVDSAAALDLYDSITHPHTFAERQARARILERERRGRIRHLKNVLSGEYGAGTFSVQKDKEREGERRLSGSYRAVNPSRQAKASQYAYHHQQQQQEEEEGSQRRGGGGGATVSNRGVKVAISSPVRINDFSVNLDLDLHDLEEKESIGSLDSEDYHAYNNDALDTIGWRGR